MGLWRIRRAKLCGSGCCSGSGFVMLIVDADFELGNRKGFDKGNLWRALEGDVVAGTVGSTSEEASLARLHTGCQQGSSLSPNDLIF